MNVRELYAEVLNETARIGVAIMRLPPMDRNAERRIKVMQRSLDRIEDIVEQYAMANGLRRGE